MVRSAGKTPTKPTCHALSTQKIIHGLSKNIFITLVSQLEHSIASARSSYVKSLISTFHKDSKKLFSLFNESKSSSSPCTLIFNSLPIHNPVMKAKIFNEYFHSVYSHSNFSLPPVIDLFSSVLLLSTIDSFSTDIYESPTA